MAAMTELVPPVAPRVSKPLPQWAKAGIAAAVALVVLIVVFIVVASGGNSQAETRYLAAVQSGGVALSDDVILQAGHDVCDNKSIDYIGDAGARLIITAEAISQLCQP